MFTEKLVQADRVMRYWIVRICICLRELLVAPDDESSRRENLAIVIRINADGKH